MTPKAVSAATSVSATTWRLGSAALVMSFVLDPLGNGPKTVAFVVVLLAAIQVFVSKPVDDTVNITLLVLTATIVGIAALEIINPNVPSLEVGLIGFRKSATFLLGVAMGLGWRGSRMGGLRLAWGLLLAEAVISLLIHLAFPSIERSIVRRSGLSTWNIGGVERMQGLLGGPFHVSMLGAFLFISAFAPGIVIRQRWLRVTAAVVGLACVYFSQVRTGIAAIAIGALILTVATGSARRWVGRLTSVAAVGVLAVAFIDPLTEYARKVTALRVLLDSGLEDKRFTGRFTTWSKGLEMVDQSPLVGNGSGSAGDTLDSYFVGAEHVTSHNVFLKYAVEGGVFQGILFISLCIGLGLAVRRRRDPTLFGLAAGVSLLAFGAVGSAVEAIPVSLGMAVILGLCARKQTTAPADDAASITRSAQHLSDDRGTGHKISI